MKIFNICFQIGLMLAASSAFSQPENPIYKKIETTLNTNARTVSCAFEMDRKNIVKMDIDGDGDKEFVALYIHDFGYCEGSGSWTSILAVLEEHNNDDNKGIIYVRPEMTMPVITGIGLPRFIDRIFIKDGQLWFAGRIHAEKDGNNFPSIPVQAQVQLLHSEVQVNSKNKRTVYYWKSTIDFQDK